MRYSRTAVCLCLAAWAPTSAQAQSAAPPSTCTLAPTRTTIGSHANVLTGLSLVSRAGRIALGWAVPSSLPHGLPDYAVAELAPDGSLRAMVDPEDPDHPPTVQNAEIWSVVPVIPGESGPITVQLDRRPGAGSEPVCSAPDDLRGHDAPPRTRRPESADSRIFCRTMGGDADFVLVQRPIISRISFFGATVLGVRLDQVRGFDQLVSDAGGSETEDDFQAILSRARIDAADGVHLTNGHAIAFRFRSQLSFGWLGQDYAATARTPTPLRTLGGEVGAPHLAFNGRDALLVYADRPARHGVPYGLRAVRIAPNATPGASIRLDTTSDTTAAEFAPSVTALSDGSWLIVWSRGPAHITRTTRAAAVQQVYARHYAPDLTPLEPPILLSDADNASDAVVAPTSGGDAVIALMVGRENTRTIRTVAMHCPVAASAH